MNSARLLILGILFLSLFYIPFWIVFFLGILFMFYFNDFYEFIFLMFFADLLFAVRETRFDNFLFVSFFFSVVVFYCINFLKERLKFNPFGQNDNTFI